jgi:hypothetical protein
VKFLAKAEQNAALGRVRQGRFSFRFLLGRTIPSPPVSLPLGLIIMPMNKSVIELLGQVKSTADFGYVTFDSINATNELGDNALHCVCVWGDMDAAKLLVENGIDVNQEGEFGFTPLRIAVDFGYLEIAEYLRISGTPYLIIETPKGSAPDIGHGVSVGGVGP